MAWLDPGLSGSGGCSGLHVVATLKHFSDAFAFDLDVARKIDPSGSDFAIHPMADIFGEADTLLSRTTHQRWVAAEGGGEAILDQSDPLANARRQEMNGSL